MITAIGLGIVLICCLGNYGPLNNFFIKLLVDAALEWAGYWR